MPQSMNIQKKGPWMSQTEGKKWPGENSIDTEEEPGGDTTDTEGPRSECPPKVIQG